MTREEMIDPVGGFVVPEVKSCARGELPGISDRSLNKEEVEHVL